MTFIEVKSIYIYIQNMTEYISVTIHKSQVKKDIGHTKVMGNKKYNYPCVNKLTNTNAIS